MLHASTFAVAIEGCCYMFPTQCRSGLSSSSRQCVSCCPEVSDLCNSCVCLKHTFISCCMQQVCFCCSFCIQSTLQTISMLSLDEWILRLQYKLMSRKNAVQNTHHSDSTASLLSSAGPLWGYGRGVCVRQCIMELPVQQASWWWEQQELAIQPYIWICMSVNVAVWSDSIAGWHQQRSFFYSSTVHIYIHTVCRYHIGAWGNKPYTWSEPSCLDQRAAISCPWPMPSCIDPCADCSAGWRLLALMNTCIYIDRVDRQGDRRQWLLLGLMSDIQQQWGSQQ